MLMVSTILTAVMIGSIAPSPSQIPGSEPLPVRARGSEVRLEARLSGMGPASGKADYRERTKNGQTQLRFSVQIEDAAPGTTFEILHNGQLVGTVATDGLGLADFNRRDTTDDPGIHGDVPQMSAGDQIEVVGLASGTLD